jgi:hypothetical protein
MREPFAWFAIERSSNGYSPARGGGVQLIVCSHERFKVVPHDARTSRGILPPKDDVLLAHLMDPLVLAA